MHADQVAKWMLDQLETRGQLCQRDAAAGIREHFGAEFVYLNTNQHLAIKRAVLDEFRRLSGERVVWDRIGKYWRQRGPHDPPGRLTQH